MQELMVINSGSLVTYFVKAADQICAGAGLSFIDEEVDEDRRRSTTGWAVLLREKYCLPDKVPLIDTGMSGSEQEGKGEAKMVSIPLSSDEETPAG